MKFISWGAAEQVTGSMHMLELQDGYKILIDCGLDYEHKKNNSLNDHFPFDVEDIDLILLTHAHIDHSGNLPTIVKHGYSGQILSTAATKDLSELLLSDSVNIFVEKAKKKKHHHKRKSFNEFHERPLYLHKHVMETMDRFVTIPFEQNFEIKKDVNLKFIPTGHLLGAAAIELKIVEDGVEKIIVFSGDIGRKNYPILCDPTYLEGCDYLICESTYGGRLHTTDKTIEEVLIENIEATCIKQPGRLIIPAFSIGRTQALVYSLHKIFKDKKLPKINVFVDSPMGMAGTEVYRKHHALLNEEAQTFFQKFGDEFEFDGLKYVETLKESKQISNYFEPCIIISSAGMLEGGRIQDHLYHNIQNYYANILFIGYCAKGTLGHRLLRGDPVINLRHRELSVFATIKQTDLFSGHGDHNDLVNFVKQQQPTKLKKVFLVHGELNSMESLGNSLIEENYQVEIAKKGLSYQLD
jgi:metallo-beta-lactamase family protein